MGDEVRWFYLQLDDGQAGPWTVEEVVAAVESGRAVASTPFWEEGMEAWEPLVKLIPELGAPDEAPEPGQPAPGPVVVAAMSPNPSEVLPAAVAETPPPAPAAPPAFEAELPPEPGSARMIALQMRMDARRKVVGATWLTLAWAFAFIGAGLALFYFKPPFFWAGAGCMAVAAVSAFVSFFYGRPLGGVFALLAAVAIPFGTFTYVKRNDLRPFGIGIGGGGQATAQVVLSDESIRVQPGKVLYSAIVTNELDQPVRDVVVTFELLDADGNVVKTVREAVTGNGALPAGASARVEIEAEAGDDVADPRSRVTFKPE